MLDRFQLEALVAVLRNASFERAAQALRITPSAVSQRIKALEESVGAVLIVRGPPCRPTPVGARIFRHAEEVGLLEQDLLNGIHGVAGRDEKTTIAIAVNSDSLATWFSSCLTLDRDVLYYIACEDQDHTTDLLRSGQVSAAVSASKQEVAGCRCRPLGSLRYRAVATPAFIEQYFHDGVTANTVARAPGLLFSNKDNLLSQWSLASFGISILPPTHWLPSTDAILQGTLNSLGWGINPEHLVQKYLARNQLVELTPNQALDVPLYWHWSRAVEKTLSCLTVSVRDTARAWLVQDT
jgi:LysR family transcriptional regulator (chromosome initiation inhibitor)